jgi:hypothetical protein
MVDHTDVFRCPLTVFSGKKIPREYFHVGFGIASQNLVQPIQLPRRPDEALEVAVSALEKQVDDFAANESVGPGDQNRVSPVDYGCL